VYFHLIKDFESNCKSYLSTTCYQAVNSKVCVQIIATCLLLPKFTPSPNTNLNLKLPLGSLSKGRTPDDNVAVHYLRTNNFVFKHNSEFKSLSTQIYEYICAARV